MVKKSIKYKNNFIKKHTQYFLKQKINKINKNNTNNKDNFEYNFENVSWHRLGFLVFTTIFICTFYDNAKDSDILELISHCFVLSLCFTIFFLIWWFFIKKIIRQFERYFLPKFHKKKLNRFIYYIYFWLKFLPTQLFIYSNTFIYSWIFLESENFINPIMYFLAFIVITENTKRCKHYWKIFKNLK